MTAPHTPLWHRVILLLLITAGAALAFGIYVKLMEPNHSRYESDSKTPRPR